MGNPFVGTKTFVACVLLSDPLRNPSIRQLWCASCPQAVVGSTLFHASLLREVFDRCCNYIVTVTLYRYIVLLVCQAGYVVEFSHSYQLEV